MTEVRTRFAPSPTGYLHIGGARTALFNYLFAKKHNGKFLLRIEDTDKERSTTKAKEAIIESLEWLDLLPDEEIIYQSQCIENHKKIAKQLLNNGNAYYCYTPQEEINSQREQAKAKGEHFIFRSKWRDTNEAPPKNTSPVIRLKAPRKGSTIINDLLQGDVTVDNSHLDDMVLCRADGTPTYMLAAVVDDYEMGITHVIRGDDHLNNAARQILIYKALGWNVPHYVHIPLIHGPDGSKLSKRHGALGAHEYKNMGYLPDAVNNYLLRLGWAHGDDEIISRTKATELFDIKGMGKSPSRIDFAKMKHINAHYLRNMDNKKLADIVFSNLNTKISNESKDNIIKAMDCIKPRSELISDVVHFSKIFILEESLEYSAEAKDIISETSKELISKSIIILQNIEGFNKDNIQAELKKLAKENDMKLGALMKPLRAYITGMTASPSVFEIMEIIGPSATIARLEEK